MNRWRTLRRLDDQIPTARGNRRGALGPKGLDLSEPTQQLAAEPAVARVLCRTQLLGETGWAGEWDMSRRSVDRPTLPGRPEVKIENARGVSQGGHHLALHGNTVLVDLPVERFAQGDGISGFFGGSFGCGLGGIEPELHAIEKVKSTPVNHAVAGRLVLGAEENSSRKDSLEALNDSPIMIAVRGQVEEIEHLRSSAKSDGAALLAERQRGDPDGDQAILAERNGRFIMHPPQ